MKRLPFMTSKQRRQELTWLGHTENNANTTVYGFSNVVVPRPGFLICLPVGTNEGAVTEWTGLTVAGNPARALDNRGTTPDPRRLYGLQVNAGTYAIQGTTALNLIHASCGFWLLENYAYPTRFSADNWNWRFGDFNDATATNLNNVHSQSVGFVVESQRNAANFTWNSDFVSRSAFNLETNNRYRFGDFYNDDPNWLTHNRQFQLVTTKAGAHYSHRTLWSII